MLTSLNKFKARLIIFDKIKHLHFSKYNISMQLFTDILDLNCIKMVKWFSDESCIG
jgi:hypothetical protein